MEAMTDTVQTSHGIVRGRIGDGVSVFLGIPYGASTTGSGRFRPPRAVEPWSGIRDVLELGPRCPQVQFDTGAALREFGEPLGEASSEDCLRLNVWTPATDGARRPVLVYLHGGGYLGGSGGAPAYDGTHLATQGDIVVVTINHRVGILGFLHLADLAEQENDYSGNAGLLDIVAALEWVRDNVERFGGDPDRVTVGGQSGGGWKTSMLLAMPSARALFHRAIIMSGAMLTAATRDNATALASQVLRKLDLGVNDLNALDRVSVETLIAAQAAMPPPDVRAPYEFRPVVDGDALPMTPLEALRHGDRPDVAMLIGCTRDEQTRMLRDIRGSARDFVADDQEAAVWLADLLGDHTAEVLGSYRRSRPAASATEVYVAVSSDLWTRIPSILVAEERLRHGASVFMYRFDWESTADEGALRACHSLDLPFVFNNTQAASLVDERSDAPMLADAMSKAWIAFVRTGDPAHASLGPWPSYSIDKRETMIFDTTCRIVNDPSADDRLAWSGVPTACLGQYQIPFRFEAS